MSLGDITWPHSIDEWDELLKSNKGWEMLIPEWLPSSLNSLIRNSYKSYASERRWVQSFLSQRYRDIPPAMGKRGVKLVIVKKGGQWDDASNLDGRSKAPLDAMTKLGMIRDDNHRWLTWHHVQEVHGIVSGTVIRLWEDDGTNQD